MVMRICVICEIEFETSHSRQITCSPAHSKKLHHIQTEPSRKKAQKEYRERNREQLKQKNKEYHKLNREREKLYADSYRKKNHDMLIEKARKTYKENPQKRLASGEKWRQANIEKVRSWEMKRRRIKTAKMRLAEFQFQASTLAQGTNSNDNNYGTAGITPAVQTIERSRAIRTPKFMRSQRRTSADRRRKAYG